MRKVALLNSLAVAWNINPDHKAGNVGLEEPDSSSSPSSLYVMRKPVREVKLISRPKNGRLIASGRKQANHKKPKPRAPKRNASSPSAKRKKKRPRAALEAKTPKLLRESAADAQLCNILPYMQGIGRRRTPDNDLQKIQKSPSLGPLAKYPVSDGAATPRRQWAPLSPASLATVAGVPVSPDSRSTANYEPYQSETTEIEIPTRRRNLFITHRELSMERPPRGESARATPRVVEYMHHYANTKGLDSYDEVDHLSVSPLAGPEDVTGLRALARDAESRRSIFRGRWNALEDARAAKNAPMAPVTEPSEAGPFMRKVEEDIPPLVTKKFSGEENSLQKTQKDDSLQKPKDKLTDLSTGEVNTTEILQGSAGNSKELENVSAKERKTVTLGESSSRGAGSKDQSSKGFRIPTGIKNFTGRLFSKSCAGNLLPTGPEMSAAWVATTAIMNNH